MQALKRERNNTKKNSNAGADADHTLRLADFRMLRMRSPEGFRLINDAMEALAASTSKANSRRIMSRLLARLQADVCALQAKQKRSVRP